MHRSPLVDVAGLSFTYEGRSRPALSGLSFQLAESRSLLVLGPSGSGKSTLTLCLNGLIPGVVEGEYQGSVSVAGVVTQGTPVHVLATEMGLVFQDPEAQFCTLTVEDEVAFGLENLRVPPEAMAARIGEALALVGLEGFEPRRLELLSGGEKQRVALASVLAMRPRLIVLDEPSANLDPRGAAELFRVLRDLHQEGRHTLVLIEHRLDEVIEWIDEVMVLSADGGLVTMGEPHEVFYGAADELRRAGVWVPRVVEIAQGLINAGWNIPGRPVTPGELVNSLAITPGWDGTHSREPAQALDHRAPAREVGSPAAADAFDPERRSDPGVESGLPFLQTRNLCFTYRGPRREPALTDVSLEIARGELVALVGGNGAGKSTLASLLSGILPAPPGTVFLEGADVRSLRPARVASLVGHVFQNPEHQFIGERVIGEITVGRNGGGDGSAAMSVDEAVAWLGRFDLAELAEFNPFTLSQGQKRRLSVAAMMVRGQQALILDEPTFGQDREQSERLMSTLVALNNEGRTVLVVTHDLELVARYAKRVLVLAAGRLVFDGAPTHLFDGRHLPESWGLTMPLAPRLCRDLQAADLWRPAGGPALAVSDFLLRAGTPDRPRSARTVEAAWV